jgi:hypothetical protein
VFLEVLLEGFPPLKLTEGNPNGLSAKEWARWTDRTADYVGLAISWQTQRQQISVEVVPAYMLASLGNKWVPLFSKTSLSQQNQNAENRRQELKRQLETRKYGRTTLQDQLNQAKNYQVTLDTGAISLEASNFRRKKIDRARTNIRRNEEEIDNLERNLIPAIDTDLERLRTLQQFADACKHQARVGFRLYCKAEDHKLVLYEALPNETAHRSPNSRPPKTPPQPPAAILRNLKMGLVAWYPFNGNAADESGNGNHGTVHGPTLTFDRHNMADQAYYFGQDSRIEVPKPKGLTPINTVSCWANVEIEKEYSYVVNFGNNNNWLEIVTGNRVRTGGNGVLDSRNSLQTDAWSHIARTSTGSQITLFINGKSDSSIASNSPNPGAMTIGGSDRRSGFRGVLDDIRIYNRALRAEEIKALYHFERTLTSKRRR